MVRDGGISMKPLLTCREVAERLQVGVRTVYSLIKERKIDYICVTSRTIRICEESLDKFLKQKELK